MPELSAAINTIRADARAITLCGSLPPGAPRVVLVSEFQPFDSSNSQPLNSNPFSLAPGPFELTLPRFDGKQDRIYRRFSVEMLSPGQSPVRLAGPCQVNYLADSAADYDYPSAPTIKGLQVHMIEDALALGVGHAALNLNIGNILRPGPAENHIPFEMDGRTFYFDGEYLSTFDRRVKTLSDHGIVVNLILLNALRWDGIEIHPDLRAALVHPTFHPEGLISAFNVTNAESLDYYKAFVEFTAARYTRPDQAYGRACGLIIGNEVDSQWMWGNAGEMKVAQYVREYSVALRAAFYAARKHYAQARVYVSLDHLWTRAFTRQTRRYYKGRDILDGLNNIYRAEGDFEWSLAYHPYPEDLAHPDFWHDKTATRSFDTKRITFKNIEILSQYLAQPHYLFDGRLRHIILSEQGFHSDETEAGERLQAAAYAYAYWKIARTPGIESFILHAHVDNRDEFNLNLGLWRRDKTSPLPSLPGSPKPIYEVFKQVDGPDSERIFREARAIVGDRSWK